MNPPEPRAFATRDQLSTWLASNHATEPQLWVRIYKKGSGTPSVTWEDCVVAALTWGWIDGQRRALDERSFLQRLTPRRPRSNWSTKNRAHAERLIADGRMQPSGLAHVEAARQDGRWEQAYAGSAEMVMPADLLAALAESPAAQRFFATLQRRDLFTIYHRLHTAKRAETRQRRMAALLDQLARGEAFR